MKNVTALFTETFLPKKALVIYQSGQDEGHVYVEAYDMDRLGRPVNAHPLSIEESSALADSLNASDELKNSWLKSKGLLPGNLLYIHPSNQGFAVWHTPEQEVGMLFRDVLGVPSGNAFVPPLIWKADKNSLSLFALKTHHKPSLETPLFCAPFFNLYKDGKVCMGTVETGMDKINCLEDFMTAWESCCWGSYFSHLIGGESPINGNIVQFWQQQVNSKRKFPPGILKAEGKTIKDLIV